jgi:hypothetical protein
VKISCAAPSATDRRRDEARLPCSGDDNSTRGIFPDYVLLPKPGQKCPWTNLNRSELKFLIESSVENRFQPPVRSYFVRKFGAKTGYRVVDLNHLISYLSSRHNSSSGVGHR